MESSLNITGADAGSILLAEKDSIIFKTVRGIDSRKLAGFYFPKSQGIAGWVIDNGSAVRVNDAKNDSRFNPEVDRLTGY